METGLNMNSYSCKYCNKVFKKVVIRDKHEYEQLCIPVVKRTYCKVCSWTANDLKEYAEHLISRAHLDNVGRINVDSLDIIIRNPVQDKMVTLFACDPVLSQCDTEIQNDLKVFHLDGSISRVKNISSEQSLHELSLSDVDKAVRDVEVANAGIINYKDLVERERGMAQMTPRQKKIMDYLCKYQYSGVKEMIERFKVVLDKLGIDDADFLGTHIRNCEGLTIEAKQIYGSYMEKFINVLMRYVMEGETLYRDMDIFDFVAKLTK